MTKPSKDNSADVEEILVNVFKLGMLDTLGGRTKPNPMPALKEAQRNIEELIAQHRKDLLQEVLDSLPEKAVGKYKKNGYFEGYNMAIDEIRSAIKDKIKNGGE